MENLIVCERVDGKWGVVFYPFVGCDIEQAMALATFPVLAFAEKYREQFIATLRDYDRRK